MTTLHRNVTLLALRNLQKWLGSLPKQDLPMRHFLHGDIQDILYDCIEGELFPADLAREIDHICEEVNK